MQPIHIGRSKTSVLEIIVSIISGFASSFLAFTVTAYHQSFRAMRGQLVSGSVTSSKEYPSTLGMVENAVNGQNPILHAMSSTAWWVTVVVCGLIAAFLIFKIRQRYMFA